MPGSIFSDDEKAGGNSDALPPNQEEKKAILTNDEGLSAIEIIGRCSKCHITGTIEYPRAMIPPKDADKLLAYKPVSCFCPKCRKTTEFVPIAYKKYPDLPFLKTAQERAKKDMS